MGRAGRPAGSHTANMREESFAQEDAALREEIQQFYDEMKEDLLENPPPGTLTPRQAMRGYEAFLRVMEEAGSEEEYLWNQYQVAMLLRALQEKGIGESILEKYPQLMELRDQDFSGDWQGVHNGMEIGIFRGNIFRGTTGIGSSALQNISRAEMLLGIEQMQDVVRSGDRIMIALQEIESDDDFQKFLASELDEELRPDTLSDSEALRDDVQTALRRFREIASRNFLQDAIKQSTRARIDDTRRESVTYETDLRLRYASALGAALDLQQSLHALLAELPASSEQRDDLEEISSLLARIEDNEIIQDARNRAQQHGRHFLFGSQLIAWSEMQGALEDVRESESPATAAAWGHLADRLDSYDQDSWLQNPDLSVTEIEQITRLLRGAQIVDADPLYRKIAEMVQQEEEDIRLKGALHGKRPRGEIMVVPNSAWMDDMDWSSPEERMIILGQHVNQGTRRSFVYAEPLELSTMSTGLQGEEAEEELLQRARKVLVHEFIHAGQAAHGDDENGRFMEHCRERGVEKEVIVVAQSVKEAVVESLTLARLYPDFANDMSKISLDHSYPEEVATLAEFFESANLRPDKKMLLLEELASKTPLEQLQTLEKIFPRENFLREWLQSLREKEDQSLEAL